MAKITRTKSGDGRRARQATRRKSRAAAKARPRAGKKSSGSSALKTENSGVIAAGALKEPRHELFAQRVAEGMQFSKAYVTAGFAARGARQNASRLMAREDIAARVSALIQASARRRDRTFNSLNIRLQTQRLDMLQDAADRMRSVIEHRSKGESALSTGLMTRRTHAVGSGDNQIFEEREEFDRPLVEELRATGRQAAEELGEWREKVVVEWDGDPTKLSDEQLEKMMAHYKELAERGEKAIEAEKTSS